MNDTAQTIVVILLWGMLATLAMSSVMFASQNLGWSRLNLPLLIGTFFTGDRQVANLLGFLFYSLGGWLFGVLYYLLFSLAGTASWWLGGLVGFVHGAVLLTAILPMLPYAHPRVASEYDGAGTHKRLEPPGFLALHYGYRTPLVALVAHTVFGLVLGWGFHGNM